jgi:hypothetical protein
MRNKTCLVFILFDYFVIMKQKFMNYYLCSVRFDIRIEGDIRVY